jgi:glycosyltransferase involved in cell wall biosynthesis
MRILVANTQVPFVRGGAEILAEGLRDALVARGHQAEIVSIPFQWYPPERILDGMLACRLLDLTEASGSRVDLLIGLRFPAYCIPHPHKALWIVHQHRNAYDLWGHPMMDLQRYPNGAQVRDAIQQADRQLIPEARVITTISRNVSRRLQRYCGIASKPLYNPPAHAGRFHCDGQEDYLFYPSRLDRSKRQDLVVEALARTRLPVKIRFAGAPNQPAYADELRERARGLGVSGRIEWLGLIPEEEKIERYARSLGVLFPPLDEDYGYVSLEAMLSSKPLITCTDSGGPLEFVEPGVTGLVADPTPDSLAEAMDTLWENRARAQEMGRAAREHYADMRISWDTVIEGLLSG